jgi:hypothetical protein
MQKSIHITGCHILTARLLLLGSGYFFIDLRGSVNMFSAFRFLGNAVLYKNSVVFLKSSLSVSFLIKYMVQLVFQENSKFYTAYSKLYMVGLGFKNFILGNFLYILVGDCNYVIFEIPQTVKVFCKKNQLYFLSKEKSAISDFMYNIKTIKRLNFYKGKGVLLFKNFKFTKLKVGKKQRFA